MSYVLLDPRRVAKDGWRNGWGRRQNEPKVYSGEVVVPWTYEEVCGWARVVRKDAIADRMRSREVLYVGDTKKEVVVRFQGFLGEKFNISLSGNWDGKLEHAPKAFQFLSLTRGWSAFDREWVATLNAANNLRRFCFTSVLPGRDFTGGIEFPGDLYFQRRVMTKITEDNSTEEWVTDKHQEIAPAWKKAVGDKWRIVDGLRLGVRDGNGFVIECAPAMFNKGDFVEVIATMEIFETQGGVKVHFVPELLVRMVSTEVVRKTMYPRLTNGATDEAPKKRKRTQVPLNNVLTGAEEGEDGNEDLLEQVTKKMKLYEACRSVVEGSGVSSQAGDLSA